MMLLSFQFFSSTFRRVETCTRLSLLSSTVVPASEFMYLPSGMVKIDCRSQLHHWRWSKVEVVPGRTLLLECLVFSCLCLRQFSLEFE